MKQKIFYCLALLLVFIPSIAYSQTTTYSITAKPGAGSAGQVDGDVTLISSYDSYGFGNSALTCSQAQDGNDLLYNYKYSGDDLDDNGSIDTVKFTIRVSGYKNTSYSFTAAGTNTSSVSDLGSSAMIEGTNSFWGVNDGSETTLNDIDAGETIKFEVENLSISVASPYVIDLTGITSAYITETDAGHTHQFISGLGNDLDAFSTNSDETISYINNEKSIYLTGAGSNDPGNREWGVQSISFGLTVSNPNNSTYWDLEDYSSYETGASHEGINYPAKWMDEEKYPCHSWETVPLYLTFKDGATPSDEDYKTAAEYSLVVTSGSRFGETTWDQGMWNANAELKSYNPNVVSSFYMNLQIAFPWYLHTDEFYEHSEWIGADTIRDYNTYNHNNAELRQFWVDNILNGLDDPNVNFAFIDKTSGLASPFYNESGVANNNMSKSVDLLYKSLPEDKFLIGNTLRNESSGGNRSAMQVYDGSYLERWGYIDRDYRSQTQAEAFAVSIQMMREALTKGKLILFRNGDDVFQETGELTTSGFYAPLAGFLIAVEKNGFMSYGNNVVSNGDWDNRYLEYLSNYLGEPLGDPIKDGLKYSRSFENLDVTLDLSVGDSLKDAVATFNWKGMRRPMALYDYSTETNIAKISSVDNSTLTENISNPVRKCECQSEFVGKIDKADNEEASISFDISDKLIYGLSHGIFRIKLYTDKADIGDSLTFVLKNINDSDPEASSISKGAVIESNENWVEYKFDFRGETMLSSVYNTIDIYLSNPDATNSNSVSYYFESLRSSHSEEDKDDGEITDNNSQSIKLIERFDAYSDPFTQQFIIELVNKSTENYQVFDINGNELLVGLTNGKSTAVDASKLAAGVYLVKVGSQSKIVYKIGY